MKNFLVLGSVVALVALFIWLTNRPAAVVLSPTPASARLEPFAAPLILTEPCAVCDQATAVAALTHAQINLNAQHAQATATADIVRANTLATTNASAATEGVALTQEKVNTLARQAQAAATADIQRAHTLATVNAAIATQRVAQTQEQFSANLLRAQIAATADMGRDNTLATANALSATSRAAETEAVLQQLRLQLASGATASAATQKAHTVVEQRLNTMVIGTATALANLAAFQAANAPPAAPSGGGWVWGLPLFVLSVAVVVLWGTAYWLGHKNRRAEVEAPRISYLPPHSPEVLPADYPLAEPSHREVQGWLDDVKRKLLLQRKK